MINVWQRFKKMISIINFKLDLSFWDRLNLVYAESSLS